MPDLDPAAWSAVFAGVSTLIVLVTAVLAIRQLRVIARNHRLQAYDFFLRSWRDVRESRQFIFETFVFDPDHPPVLNSAEGEHLRSVINNLNEIGLLVEQGDIPAHYVLSLCNADLVRLHYRLQPYLEYREAQIGSPYGRRIGRLANRAKRYHAMKPNLRNSSIRTRVPPAQTYVTVYKPELRSGLNGLAQKLGWFLARALRRY